METKMEITFEKTRAAAYDGNMFVGECCFSDDGSVWTVTHTAVDPCYGGQGIARKMLQCVAKNAAERGAKLAATCSYAVHEFEKHPEVYAAAHCEE